MKSTLRLIALLITVLALTLTPNSATPVEAASLVTETFRNSSAANWQLLGVACLTAGGTDVCPDAPTSEGNGNGWLRLTSTTGTFQSGSAIYNTAFSSTGGIQVTFTYATYGGTGADGISFYLIDGSTATPTIGAPGGSLGYSFKIPAPATPGVTNGYVGIGLDEYGNFSHQDFGSCDSPCPGRIANSVTIRGSGNLNSGFNYLTRANATIGTGSRTTAKKVRITIPPGATTYITVEMDSGSGYQTLINNFDLTSAVGQSAMPASFKMGFSASTGTATNYHEIRDLTVNGAVATTTTLISDINPSGGQTVTFTATVTGSSGTPTGTVSFLDGTTVLDTGTLNGAGQATFSTSALSVGSRSITARYEGDTNYGSSTSPVLTQVVTCANAITVANANDSGAGSLRQAMADVCDGGTIDFDANYTITLASQLPAVAKTITITGNGAASTIIQANANPGVSSYRVFLVDSSGNLTLNNLTVRNGVCAGGCAGLNSSGGGIINYGILNVTNSAVSGNSATGGPGGIANSDGTLTVTESTISGNSAGGAGGIGNSSGTLTVVNSTISGNTGTYGGIRIYGASTASIINSTISGNSGSSGSGGIQFEAGTLNLENTILANNTGGDCVGALTASKNNLIKDSVNTCGLTNGDANGNVVGTDPLLGTLGNYGGSTQTLPLLPGSPAINAGDATACASAATVNSKDQRGITRPASCDIGAFESRGFTLSTLTGTSQSTVINTAFASPLGLTVTANNASEPVSGGQVTFTAPGSGASAALMGSPATIGASGTASVTATASNTVGTYNVVASAAGATSKNFALMNFAAPTATTNAATLVTASGATLNGTVNANLDGTTVTFEYGLTTAYGTSVAATPNTVTGSTGTAVSAAITGLDYDTTYHYRVVATNSVGTTYGLDQTFKTSHVIGTQYVKPTASGVGNCSSWANACILQTALTNAVSGDELWVAAGTYKPTTVTTDRTATFQLKNGVAVYGGFAGTETLRTQRNPSTNVSILSGDIDSNDSQAPIVTNATTVTGTTNNSYHVVRGATGATLDGFIVTAGNANGASPNNSGGGMYNTNSNPTLTNITFSGNSADGGGGMYSSSSSPTLTNITFSGNFASWRGGGMYNSSSSPTLTNITFSRNYATSGGGGGGLYNYIGTPILKNVTFFGNSASVSGGLANYSSSPTLTNVTFVGNYSATEAGGMGNLDAAPVIRNTIFWGNTAANVGAQINNWTGGAPVISDSVVQSGCPVGSTCTNIITSDPLLGVLGDYGGITQTIPLLPGSSAINAGNSTYCTMGSDQRGMAYVGACDIGAFESQGFTLGSLTGTPQSAAINTAFASPLGLTVTANDASEPISGGQVTFTAPGSSASASITGNPATIAADGTASVAATANGTIGGPYNVVASATGATDVNFALTNQCSSAITVTNANDNGAGSLRQAIADVCAGGTITFNGNYTIPLVNTLTITKNMTIDGTGYTVTVNGNNAVRVFYVNTGVVFNLHSLAVSNGRASDFGGGLYNQGTANLRNAIFSSNVAGDKGGGIYTNGVLTITDSTISNNRANFSDGGGLYISGTGTLNITNSTLLGNNAVYGAGIYNGGTITLTNITLSANNASTWGGGIFTWTPVNITNSTFSGNRAISGGSGIYIVGTPVVTIKNSIIANSTGGSNCVGSPGGSNNLASDFTCGAGFNNSSSILLGTLGNYGGNTQTIPLLPGSSAINTGDNAVCAAAVGSPTYGAGGEDQRGIVRPQGTVCDIGAFESRGFTLGTLTGTPQSAAINAAFASPLGLTVTANDASEPVSGGRVTFTAPGFGAGATFTGNPATIAADGKASVSTTANGTAGSYNVTASAMGASNTATFALTNLATYTVTYDANGATSGSVPASQTKIENVDLTLATNSGNLDRTGYAFNGWNTQSNGLGTHYGEGATYTDNVALTLYAQWLDISAPVVNTFTATTPSNSLNITIPAFTASDNVSVSGYMITTSATAPVSGAAGWNATAPTTYTVASDGPYTLYPWAKDAAGNVSALFATPRTVVVDTAAPAAPVVTSPANSSTTADNTPTITGTAEANSTVTVYLDGLSSGTTTADTSGNWSYTPAASLTDGSHTVKATAADSAGNTSVDSNTNTFTVDTTAPAAPVVVAPANGSTTADNTPTVTGTAEANSTVTVYLDGSSSGTTTANASGNWSYTPATSLADGSHTVYATATDALGNVSSNSNTNTFTVDTTAPAAPVVVTPANGSTTADNTPTVTGTAEANSTVTVYLDGSSSGTTTADASGNWSYTPASALTDGPHTVKATATDGVGNTSVDSNTNTFTVDSTAPAAPVVITPANGSTTADNTPTVTGTAEINGTVTVYFDGSSSGTTTADASGNWSYTPATSLADGSHTVYATAADALNNVSPNSNTNNFIVDTTAPAAPVVVTPADGSTTADNIPTVTGTAEANSTVTVYLDGSSSGTTTADGAGNWSYTPSSALADGPHTAKATAADGAGNTSVESNTNTFTVDTTVASVTSILRQNPITNPTNADTVTFRVTFSEDIQSASVDTTDFSTILTGTVAGTINSVTSVNASEYDVEITGITGSGTLGLGFASTNNILDLAGNALGSSPTVTTSETYTIDNVSVDIVGSAGIVAEPGAVGVSDGGTYTRHFTTLKVTFTKDVSDPTGNDGEDDVTNPNNYILLQTGADGAYNTESCAAISQSDVRIPTGPVSYSNNGGSGPFTATVTINNGVPLPSGEYRLLVCGSTSIVDLAGNALNNGIDRRITFTLTDPAARLPQTGFAPERVTVLPSQTVAYADLGSLWLEIPSLGVKSSIIGVQKANGEWDVTWLGKNVGYLSGTAYPTWAGNTVLTAHVWDANNLPGPFAQLKELKYGDRFSIHMGGKVYFYEVRQNKLISPKNTSAALVHEELDWVTLLTCESYNEKDGSYTYRRIVRAVLIEVK